MSQNELKQRFIIIFLSIWAIISITSFYKMLESIFEYEYDPAYTIITSINIAMFITMCLWYIYKIINPKTEESNNLDKV